MTAPSLPGGTEMQKQRLVEFLEFVGQGLPAAWLATSEDVTRAQYQLGRLQLTQRNSGRLVLSPLGFSWLNNQDDLQLFQVLHENIAFVGEILLQLQSRPSTIAQLQEIATSDFYLPWQSSDQIRRRTAWLRVLNYIEEGGDRLWHVTPAGAAAAQTVASVDPAGIAEQIASSDLAKLELAPPILLRALQKIDQKDRQAAVGYLPKEPVAALQLLCKLVAAPTDRKDLEAELAKRLQLAESSASTFINTARTLGLHRYVGKDLIEATPLGIEWIENGTSLNLVRLMHLKFYPFGEALNALGEQAMSAGETHRRLFPIESDRPAQDRTTLVLRRMSEAGAVSQIGPFRYVATAIGRALERELPAATPEAIAEPAASSLEEQLPAADLSLDLLEASTDSAHPERFEKAIAAAFRELGVDARHVGGPGATDVLIEVHSNLKKLGRVVVDAKTASSGSLREDSVVLDTLKEHAVLHDASHIAVCAPGYQNSGRLPARAASARITLITAQSLAQMLRSHQEFPYAPEDVWQFLTLESEAEIEERRAQHLRQLRTIDLVLRELELEQTQANAQPITARDIYRTMRRETSVSESEVADILTLLSNPWIQAVNGDAKNGFTLPSTRRISGLRVSSMARVIGGLVR